MAGKASEYHISLRLQS